MPGKLVSGAIAAWLLQQGIQYLNGQFEKPIGTEPLPPSSSSTETIPATSNTPGTYEQSSFRRWTPNATALWNIQSLATACDQIRTYFGKTKGTCTDTINSSAYSLQLGSNDLSCGYVFNTSCSSALGQGTQRCSTGYELKAGDASKCVNTTTVYTCPATGGWTLNGTSCVRNTGCPDGYTFTDGQCIPTGTQVVPNDDPLWNPLKNTVPPDPVIQQLGDSGVPVPVNQPTFTPFSTPLSDWQTMPGATAPTRQTANIAPSPTINDPWRVIIEVRNETQDPSTGQSDPGLTEDEKDLCTLHPEIIACQKLEFDTPDPADIDNEDREILITPDSGWGPDTGTCPAPLTTTFMGQPVTFSWQFVCDFAVGLRPVIIAVAWVIAAMTVIGTMRRTL